MKAINIVEQLQAVLPTVTDLFSESVDITSLTRSGTTVTAVTSVDHGLSVGDTTNIVGAKSPIAISSLTFLDGIVTAITATPHDLTEGFQDGKASEDPQVEIVGATESEYNGLHSLLRAPNRTSFTYSVTGTPSTPATGSTELLEHFSLGYNGVYSVDTVPNTTTFTYEITETPNSPAQGTIKAHKSVRVARSINIERTREAYTKKEADELWAFVVLGDISVSKNRHVESDATDTYWAGTDSRQRILPLFSVFIFVPTSDQLSGAAARDQMEDIRPFLYKSLLRTNFDEGLESITQYGVITEGDGFFDYNGAIYIHQFIFSTQADVIYEDTVDPDHNVAFRDIKLEFLDELGTVELTANVNLDEE